MREGFQEVENLQSQVNLNDVILEGTKGGDITATPSPEKFGVFMDFCFCGFCGDGASAVQSETVGVSEREIS